ncbi:hypothetical protein BGP_5379 [Beggiatoa sp. PS]|nr:hypothetical protein BGP_5379 [Beggiatoa sp. PS]
MFNSRGFDTGGFLNLFYGQFPHFEQVESHFFGFRQFQFSGYWHSTRLLKFEQNQMGIDSLALNDFLF